MGKAERMRKARSAIKKSRFDLDSFEPIVMQSRTQEERDQEQVELIHAFTIDGKEYYAPTQIPFAAAMRSLDIVAERGEVAATAFQLRTVFGDDGYEALMNFDDISDDDFTRLADFANRVVMSSREGKAR